MNEISVLGTVVAGLWGLLLAFGATIWATLKERIGSQEKQIEKLQSQNTEQETTLGRLTERMKAREDIHEQHREDMKDQFSRLDVSMAEINRKLDRIIGNPQGSAGRYGQKPQSEDYLTPPVKR